MNTTAINDIPGPLTTMDSKGNTILIGVSSWGFGCGKAQAPGVYAKVAPVLPWIKNQISRQAQGRFSCHILFKIS